MHLDQGAHQQRKNLKTILKNQAVSSEGGATYKPLAVAPDGNLSKRAPAKKYRSRCLGHTTLVNSSWSFVALVFFQARNKFLKPTLKMQHQWPSSAPSRVRSTTYINGMLNLMAVVLGGWASRGAAGDHCPGSLTTAAALVCGGSGVGLLWLLGAGWAQASAAASVVGRTASGPDEVERSSDRKLRRKRYNRWLGWSRSGFLVTALQTALAILLAYQLARAFQNSSLDASGCSHGTSTGHNAALLPVLLTLVITAWLAAVLPCALGHDVLNWRSLYDMQDMAWRAHYHEVFDRNIREVMCCLGRPRYWKASEDDEINAVAALTADVLAYRARGATHLDLLAGLNLMRAKVPEQYDFTDLRPPPVAVLQEAAFLQPFAVAAYTGPVLDVGRNPFLFCCTWPYRQGVLTPWLKSRYPVLEGDNLIRGHAAAFLRYVRLPSECLRTGRVKQKRHWEAAYFLVVVPEHRCVIVAVRGTETPEDVLTDALGREVELGEEDLGGLKPSWSGRDLSRENQPPPGQKRFAHKGVAIAARELAYQLDGMPYDDEIHAPHKDSIGGETEGLAQRGRLSELLGPGGECEGYSLRFVGHSLGGGICTMTALRLRPRFPQLHVFAFNTIPSLDQETADACSKFVTSVIYNNDWASRISVASVMRLRAAALHAQSADRARRASSETGKRSPPSLPQPVAESANAIGSTHATVTAHANGCPGPVPDANARAYDLDDVKIWSVRKGGPIERGKRRVRHLAGVGCLCAHLLSCTCHMAADKDTTRGRGAIRTARKLHKAGLDIRGEIKKSLEDPAGLGPLEGRPVDFSDAAKPAASEGPVGEEVEMNLKRDAEGRQAGNDGLAPTRSDRAFGHPNTRDSEEHVGWAVDERGFLPRTLQSNGVSMNGHEGISKKDPRNGLTTRPTEIELVTAANEKQDSTTKAQNGSTDVLRREPFEGSAGRGLGGGVEEWSGDGEPVTERTTDGFETGSEDLPRDNGAELQKAPVHIERSERLENAEDGLDSQNGGGKTSVTVGSLPNGTAVNIDSLSEAVLGGAVGSKDEPGLLNRPLERLQSPPADARSVCLDAGSGSSLLAAPSPHDVVIEVSQLERTRYSHDSDTEPGGADSTSQVSDTNPRVTDSNHGSRRQNEKHRRGEPGPPESEFVGPTEDRPGERPGRGSAGNEPPGRSPGRNRKSEEGIREDIGSNQVDGSAYPRELFVPGTIVHVIRVEDGGYWPTPGFGRWKHRAVQVERTSLRELPIHASMFLDHLPWRLQGALNELLEIAKHDPPPFGVRMPSWLSRANNRDKDRQTA